MHVTLLEQGLCRACCLLKLSVLLWPLSFNRLQQREKERWAERAVGKSERYKVKRQEADERGRKSKRATGRRQENYYLLQRKIKNSKNQCPIRQSITGTEEEVLQLSSTSDLIPLRHLAQPEHVWTFCGPTTERFEES